MKFNKKKNKVIVTGGSGFVGTHTIKALKEKGYEVLNYDIEEGYDIMNPTQLTSVVKEGDKILHLAAVARIKQADEDSLLASHRNVIGTSLVGRVAFLCGAERVVYASTGSVYMPVTEEPPITEEFKANGNCPYAVTKYQGELELKASNVPYVILRYAHLYGEGKIGRGAIGMFIEKMDKFLKPTLFGGQQSNDFTYILDVVQANLLALETENVDETYNIGTGEELTTEEVFNILCKVFDYQTEFEMLPPRSCDPLRFVYSIEKSRKLLGYEPKYSFEDGMKDFKDNYDITK